MPVIIKTKNIKSDGDYYDNERGRVRAKGGGGRQEINAREYEIGTGKKGKKWMRRKRENMSTKK